jgi:hypothetical protein
MAFLTSLFAAVSVRLGMLWAAFAALPMLAGAILPVAFSGPGTLAERLLKTAAATSNQRQVFSFLRLVLPNLVLSAQFVKAYPNTGTAIVSRAEDVIEVLDREADFEVVYEPKMRAITGGENFFLGMQDSADYQRDAWRFAAPIFPMFCCPWLPRGRPRSLVPPRAPSTCRQT